MVRFLNEEKEDHAFYESIYNEFFRLMDNIEAAAHDSYDREDSELTFKYWEQTYNVLEENMDEFKSLLDELKRKMK